MKYFKLLTVLALLLASCTQNSKKQDNIPVIDFNREQNVDVSDILELDFVKLETDENCLINKSVRQIESFDGRIFILSGGESSSLFVFDRSGKFISSIGNMGNAPGEYVAITSFCIDRRRNTVSLADPGQKKIINYSTENYEFVSEHKTSDYTFLCFEYLDGNKIVCTDVGTSSDSVEWNFILADTNQRYINRYVKKEFITGYHTGPLKNLYKYKDELYAYPEYQTDHFVYRLSEDGAVPVYRLQFGKYVRPSISYLKKISAGNENFLGSLYQSDYVYNFHVFETDKALCADYTVSGAGHIGIHSKSSGKTYSYTVEEFQNMLKTGKIQQISGIVDDYVATVLQPFELIEMKAGGHEFPQKLQKLVNESKDDDNPVLCLFKVKD